MRSGPAVVTLVILGLISIIIFAAGGQIWTTTTQSILAEVNNTGANYTQIESNYDFIWNCFGMFAVICFASIPIAYIIASHKNEHEEYESYEQYR